jgi:hypothetical protein
MFSCWLSLVHEGEGHAAAGSIPHMRVAVHTCNARDLAVAADAVIIVIRSRCTAPPAPPSFPSPYRLSKQPNPQRIAAAVFTGVTPSVM